MVCFNGRTLGACRGKRICAEFRRRLARSVPHGLGCLQQYVLIVIWIFGIVASGGSGTAGKAKKGRIYHRHIDLAATPNLSR